MDNNTRIDDSLVKEVVFGRIEPKIYAFETDTIPKYLKVGDTFRSVDERLNEWKCNGFADLRKVDDWSSEIPGKDLYFRDYSVHSYLIKNGKERLTRNIFADKPFSNEFFKNASREDVEQAIAEIIKKSDCESSEYVYYSIFDRAPHEEHFERDTNEWEPRKPLQTETIERFCEARKNGRNNLLMYAVMRFGKSFTSLCCAKAMNAKMVLVVSGKADVATEWQENVERPGQFKDFVFLNTKNLKRNDSAISSAQKENKTIVLFLTLQDLAKEKRRFAELFSQTIDLMIIDETHFAARADALGRTIRDTKLPEDTVLSQQINSDGIDDESLSSVDSEKARKEIEKVSNGLTVTAKLHLSGTPYRILLGSEFEPEDRISFCQYSDIIEQKEKWYIENIAGKMQEETGKEEWDNPYYGFPEMVRFAFNLNESAKIKLQQLEEEGYSSRLSALFAPKSVTKSENNEHKEFIYKQEVLDFLLTIDGSKEDENVLGFLDNERIKSGELCHHIVMVLPFCASCDAMETLIKENFTLFKNLKDYEIINISGIDTTYNKISEVKIKISNCERGRDSSGKRKTITLTVNRMLTGCTVPEWDTMIFLKDTASPQDYDQAVFRLQSQFVTEYKGKDEQGNEKIIKKDMKPQTLLVDFDPQRMFYLQETKSRIYNINTKDGGNDESERRIEKELDISPILHISANKLVKVEPNDILKAVSEYSTNRGITEAANDIIIDESLANIEEIKRVIDKENEIGSNKGFAEQAYTGDETDLGNQDIGISGTPDDKNEKGSDKSENKNTDNSNESETGIKVFVKKCRSYYRRILFYAFLCKSGKEIKNLSEIIESIEIPENNRIFCNLGLNKDFILLMQGKMNGSAKRSLDDKIYDLYRLSHEYENDDDPIKRATTAIQKFGKISDSEVVTPQKIAKEMVDLIPESDFIAAFNNNNKFLDIASKMGEFAVAIYRRAETLGIQKDKIRNSIYSIPTSKLAFEFTRFIYEKLGLNVCNLAEQFNSYDLLKVKDANGKIDYEKICAILTQNKPFNEIAIDDEIAEGDDKVNFDVIVGNPPYQEEAKVESSSNGQNPRTNIFQYFQIIAKSIVSKQSVMIYPGVRWLHQSGKGCKQFGKQLINDSSLEEIIFYPNAADIFVETGISDGITIVSINKRINKNDFIYSFVENGEKIDIVCKHPNDELIVLNPNCIKILNKVSTYVSENNLKYLSSAILPRSLFKIESDFVEKNKQQVKEYHNQKLKSNEIKILTNDKSGPAGRTKWFVINKKIIKTNVDKITEWQVVVSSAHPGGQEGRDNKIEIIDNKSVFGRSRIALYSFKTKIEAQNFYKYCQTPFVKFLFLMTDESLSSLGKKVPDFFDYSDKNRFIDFNHELSEKLYSIFKLLPEEIAFIESTIKPME